MCRISHQENIQQISKQDDDRTRDDERPAPWALVTLTLGPEGRYDGAQNVTDICVGAPNSHDQSSTGYTNKEWNKEMNW